MRIVMVAVGSRGDVQPYVALGLGLRRAGHHVRLATSAEFEGFVRAHDLDFAPLAGDPRALLEAEHGRAWIETGANAVTFMIHLMRLVGPYLRHFLEDVSAACADAEAIIFSAFGWAAYHVAEARRVPAIGAFLQPMSRTRAFPSLIVPRGLPRNRTLNYLSYLAAEQLLWQPFGAVANAWRRETLRIGASPRLGPTGHAYRDRVPFLYGYSARVVPRPADWPRWHQVTGYWVLPPDPGWQPAPALAAFLAAGPPPVYVGFGSMTLRDAEQVTAIAVEALRLAGQRGVLLGGWANLGAGTLPETVLAVGETPHEWLLPRLAAVVHHGGAGTTGAALRAGVPSVVVPFFADQPFWAERVAALGVGPAPIPRRALTAERLAAAIRQATSDAGLRTRAARLGCELRAEDGVAAAVTACERYLADARSVGVGP